MSTEATELESEPFNPKKNAPSPEIEEWGTTTTFGVVAGMMYGGVKEALATSPSRESVLPEFNPIQNQNEMRSKRQVIREQMEKRMLQISRGTVIGAIQLGGLTSIFTGTQILLRVNRKRDDTWNTVGAGFLTGGLLGLTTSGSVATRLQSGLIGCITGGVLSFPLGFVHSYLKSLVPMEEKAKISESDKDVLPVSGIANAIKKLERNLEERAALISTIGKYSNDGKNSADEDNSSKCN